MTERQPRLVRRREFLLSVAGALVASCSGTGTPSPSRGPSYPAYLAANPSLGVWPTAYRSAAPAIRGAYEFAAANESLLRYIPCFCGCGAQGHQDNYDCFVAEAKPDGWLILDPHGLGCGTCVGVALDAKAMQEQRMTVRAIRAAIDQRWAKVGPATPTRYP
jgi:hypothetical protein